MTKIAKRTKKETAKADVAVKAPVEAKKATPKTKVTVKELQLQLEVKDQQLSDAISTIESLDKILAQLNKDKGDLLHTIKNYQTKVSEMEVKQVNLMNRGLIDRIFNVDVV